MRINDTNGISKLDLKRQNRMHILRLLRNNGPTSRIDIAREIGITKAAVTIISNEMISEGILYEKGEAQPRARQATRGRKKILLDVDDTYRLGLGLTVDGCMVTMGLCTLRGRPVERQTARIRPDCSAEQLLGTIREMYAELSYKNDLKTGTVAGLGVCVSEPWHPLMGVTRDEYGQADYSALEKALSEFIQLPMVFGSVADGLAVAAIDYHPDGEQPPVNLVVMRADDNLECAVAVGRELYRGSLGRPALSRLSEGRLGALDPAAVSRTIQRLYSEASPELLAQCGSSLQELTRLFHEETFCSGDPAVTAALNEIEEAYLWVLESLMAFYAPDRIVLFGQDAVKRPLQNAISRFNRRYPKVKYPQLKDENDPAVFDPIAPEDCCRAAAALATRAFFINRGGY